MTTINNIGSSTGSNVMPPPPPMGRTQALTDEQKTQLTEILSNYDAENMTATDVQSMWDEIRSAGIRPGEELKSILEDSDFEVEPPTGGAPPMGMRGAARPEPPQFVQDFVDKAIVGDITEDDVATFLEVIQDQNQSSTGLVIDNQF